ncbi:MAG: hypothetical protein MRZ79_09330 [Bacteroidia bacterium]|nr:hypothetical protein [Bacteroidia bacterium]
MSPQFQQVESQLASSSSQIQLYSKKFQNLQEPESDAELINFSLDSLDKDSLTHQLSDDLAYLFDVYYKDPSIAEYMDTTYLGDTLLATVKPGMEKKSKLHSQKILKDEAGNYRSISTLTRSSNWLYELEISIQANFDSLSRYEAHSLYLRNKVHYLNETIETRITGKASYK